MKFPIDVKRGALLQQRCGRHRYQCLAQLYTGLTTLSAPLAVNLLNSVSIVIDILFPPRCALCERISTDGFCNRCQLLLPWNDHPCRQCGTPLASGLVCGACQNERPHWNQLIAPFRFIDPVADRIHQLKYHDKLSFVAPLSRFLASSVIKHSSVMPEVLVPVPLHSKRFRQRGYNQAALIANAVGKLLDIPVDQHLIHKIKDTGSQTRLDEQQRRDNVNNAFEITEPARYQSIAIIDDVITSGATMKELCRSLNRQGYRQISVWALAKTGGTQTNQQPVIRSLSHQ